MIRRMSLLLALFLAIPPAAKGLPSPIEKSAREMLMNLNAGRFDVASKDFNDQMRATLPVSSLDDVRRQIVEKVGMFRTITEAHLKREGEVRMVELMARYEKYPVQVRVAFDGYDRIAAIYFNPIMPAAADPALEATARQLLENIVNARFDQATKVFNAQMLAQLPADALSALSKTIIEKYGAFRSVNEVHQRNEQGFRIIDLHATYDTSLLKISVVFDKDGKVGGLRIGPLTK